MLKYFATVLIGVSVLMLLPSQSSLDSSLNLLYGMAEITQNNENGEILSKQLIHNRIVDTGESFLVNQTFVGGGALVADNASIGSMCLFVGPDTTWNAGETLTAAAFDAANVNSRAQDCFNVAPVITKTAGLSLPSMTALFAAGTNVTAGQQINGIGICQKNPSGVNSTNCQTTGILFSFVDFTNQTLGATDTLTIKYTFNATTPGS